MDPSRVLVPLPPSPLPPSPLPPSSRPGSAPAPPGARLPEVVVRVLGPVEVVGAAMPFTRAWSLELVAYLSMHPGGASTDRWMTALWPDRLLAAATRHSTVSAARRSLGRSADGSPHLRRSGRVLELAPSVTTDWAQFRTLASTSGTAGPGAWRAALDLVRGRPFSGLRSDDWAVLEGVDAEVEDAVVQLAVRLADHELGRGDGLAAERAVRRALLVAPYDERLYRLLFRAADRQGNPAGVESAMAALLRLVAADATAVTSPSPSACDSPALTLVHPETATLYRELSRRGRSSSGPSRSHRGE